MKILLRSLRTGDYVQSFDSWTFHACAALDFQSMSRALELVRSRGLENMEVVLTDLSMCEDPMLFAEMSIAQLLAGQDIGPGHSRLAVGPARPERDAVRDWSRRPERRSPCRG
jgi:hypothetical protein